jgi:hypothetical protein
MADIKIAYGSSVDLTITSLNSLAASSSLLGGAESAAVDNTSNKYTDYLLAGYIKAGAANCQVGVIEVHVVGMVNDTEWPDVFDGTDSAETITSAEIKASACRPAAVIATTNSNDRVYPFSPVSVANLFGGSMPKKFVVFVAQTAQTSTNALASSGHKLSVTPVYTTVTA